MSSAFAAPLALGVALKALAGDVDGAGLGGPCDRAHEPGIRGDPLALGRLLDGRLQRFGEAQADPRRELLAGDAGGLAGGVDEDELGLLAGEADLDVAGG